MLRWLFFLFPQSTVVVWSVRRDPNRRPRLLQAQRADLRRCPDPTARMLPSPPPAKNSPLPPLQPSGPTPAAVRLLLGGTQLRVAVRSPLPIYTNRTVHTYYTPTRCTVLRRRLSPAPSARFQVQDCAQHPPSVFGVASPIIGIRAACSIVARLDSSCASLRSCQYNLGNMSLHSSVDCLSTEFCQIYKQLVALRVALLTKAFGRWRPVFFFID